MIGKTLSHYNVLEKIGQGGMGEVYRAEDTNLSREVAIKVLPEQFTKDPQRLARFEREAKLLASLNHPNIAAIYGFEEAEGVRFLAMELVPGETLAERVAKGPVPVEEALEVCRQIAEGVEAAHEKGVIHRDLKPANVKVTPEGKVKILDFGLAKAFEEETPITDISQSPTLTEEMTRAGVILGTAAYMSPEQAKGEAVDKRADIFAFGCVLYELLTAKRTFDGKTITETLGAIIHKDPDWNALPNTTPWRIQELLRRCLTKDAHDRLRDIATVRIEVKLALYEPAGVLPIGVGSAAQPVRQRWLMTGGLVVVAVVITGIVVWGLMRTGTPTQPPKRFTINLPSTDVLVYRGLALSPDGGSLVYVGRRDGVERLYRKSMDQFGVSAIEGPETPDVLSISPDGQSVVFFEVGGTTETLNKVSLAGGPIVTLYDLPGRRFGVAWGPDDTIVFSVFNSGLLQVSANGGIPQPVTTLEEGETGHRWPEFLPGGKEVLFTLWSGSLDSARIAVQSLETGERRTLIDGTNPHYLPTGHIVFAQLDSLWAVPFDIERLELTGSPVPVVEDVQVNSGGYAQFTIANDGSLAYIPSSGGPDRELVWVDRQGQATSVTETLRGFMDPRLSPDGKYLSVTVDDGSRNTDIWMYEIDRGTLTPLTFGETTAWPIWTLDGNQITFGSVGSGSRGLFSVPADGSGEPEQLTTSEIRQLPSSWSPDGVLVYQEGSSGRANDIWVLPQEGEAEPFVVTEFNELQPMFSPDGKWIAFASNRSGRYEVYVKAYPGEGGLVPISADGGSQPVWARSGEELFYRNGTSMMVVSVQTQPTFKAEIPRLLFEGPYNISFLSLTANYDVTPDGQRFVMVRSGQTVVQSQINIVLNWFEEVKRLVPTP